MATANIHFYKATIINPKSDTSCDFFPQGLLVVEGNKIKDVLSLTQGQSKYSILMSEANTTDFSNALIVPAFYDMHFHWVQDDVRSMAKDSLLQWLEKYTFPTEAKFADRDYAQKRAEEFFKKLTSMGTLGGACYSSIHEHALDAAMEHVKGDFVIGNVLMNMNSPEDLTHGEEESLSLTKRLIERYGRRHGFTPRFAITTTPGVMREGSRMADEAQCFKQTHLSETPGEIDFVLSLYREMEGFEGVESYTEIYEKTGMLGRRSLMGHGIHLSDKELAVLSRTETSVIHCPTSNAPIEQKGLGSGLFDFKKTEAANVRWALGSDIGGGPYLSMLDVMRSFVDQNRATAPKEATYVKALYRSTLAGAEIMEHQSYAGNLDVGKDANFVVLPLERRDLKSAEEVLSELIEPYHHRREDLETYARATYFRGEALFSRSHN